MKKSRPRIRIRKIIKSHLPHTVLVGSVLLYLAIAHAINLLAGLSLLDCSTSKKLLVHIVQQRVYSKNINTEILKINSGKQRDLRV